MDRAPLSRADGSQPSGSWKQKRRLRGPSVLGPPSCGPTTPGLSVEPRGFGVLCFPAFGALWPALPLSRALGWGSLRQVGIALKPFLPQLQTTFTKALQDSNRGVRLKAADALGKLISIHIKVDPLFTELLNGIRVMEDPGVR